MSQFFFVGGRALCVQSVPGLQGHSKLCVTGFAGARMLVPGLQDLTKVSEFQEAESRRSRVTREKGLTHPDDASPKNQEGYSRSARDLLCTSAPGGGSTVRCLRLCVCVGGGGGREGGRGHALRVGRQRPSADVTHHSDPTQTPHWTRQETTARLTAPHPVQTRTWSRSRATALLFLLFLLFSSFIFLPLFFSFLFYSSLCFFFLLFFGSC